MNARCLMCMGLLMVPMLITAAQPETRQPSKPESRISMDDSALRDSLSAQEKKIWEAMKGGDWQTVEAMCSDKFVMVCPAGFQSKGEASEMGKKGKLNSYTLSDWRAIKLDENTGIILYKAECVGTPAEGGSDRSTSYHSTVWRRQGGAWLADMHQMTKQEGKS